MPRTKLLLITLLLASSPALAHDAGVPLVVASVPSNVERELSFVKDALAEVRRDELNYRLDRDLLKDAYAANIEKIQLFLAIVLGAFTAFGFFGVRSVGVLRNEFKSELDELRKLRTDLVSQIKELESQQKDAQKKLGDLSNKDADHDKRLRVLEIQEKAGTYIQGGQHARALEYITVGLTLDPDDRLLLGGKFTCLFQLGRYSEAGDVGRDLLKREPDEISLAENLAEVYLVGGNLAAFEDLIAKCKAAILSGPHPAVIDYFDVFRLFLKQDLAAMKDQIREKLKTWTGVSARIPGWGFSEIRKELVTRNDLKGREHFLRFLEVMEGHTDAATLEASLSGPDT